MKTLGPLAFALLLVAACSSTEDTVTPAAATVTLTGTKFEPATVTIKVGQTVKWNWADGVHNVVSGTSCTPDGTFSSGKEVSGGTFEQRFDTAGTFDYYCAVHCASGMVGQVIVQ